MNHWRKEVEGEEKEWKGRKVQEWRKKRMNEGVGLEERTINITNGERIIIVNEWMNERMNAWMNEWVNEWR